MSIKIRVNFEVSGNTTCAGDSKTISTYWSVYVFSLWFKYFPILPSLCLVKLLHCCNPNWFPFLYLILEIETSQTRGRHKQNHWWTHNIFKYEKKSFYSKIVFKGKRTCPRKFFLFYSSEALTKTCRIATIALIWKYLCITNIKMKQFLFFNF